MQGIVLARDRQIDLPAPFRLSLALAAIIAFVATLVTAGYLSQQNGHWIGRTASDVNGLPLLGWSRTGGDLRVPHFWALHVQQLLPIAGGLIAGMKFRYPRIAVAVVALAYTAFIIFTFMQALSGRPFIN